MDARATIARITFRVSKQVEYFEPKQQAGDTLWLDFFKKHVEWLCNII